MDQQIQFDENKIKSKIDQDVKNMGIYKDIFTKIFNSETSKNLYFKNPKLTQVIDKLLLI